MKIKENKLNDLRLIKSNLILKGKVKDPFLSIIIPTYKRTELLKGCLGSILQQKTKINYEIIVVDDNPNETENQKMILNLEKSKIFYYKNIKNLGIYDNMNMGVILSKGKWISFLHDDDLLKENFLEEISIILQQNSNITVLDNRIEMLDLRENIKKTNFYNLKSLIKNYFYDNSKIFELNFLDFFYYADIGGVGTVVKKEIFIKSGGFNTRYYPSSDYYFWIYLYQKYKNIYIYNKKLSIRRFDKNESLKKEVVEGFIINDYYLKTILAKENILLNFYKKIFVIRNIKIWEKEWQISVNKNKIYQKLDLDVKYSKNLYLILGRIITIVYTFYKILRLMKGKKIKIMEKE